MLLGETSAKEIVCPIGMMRASYDGNWDKGRCIGSRCMAWRWDDPDPGTLIRRTALPLTKSDAHGRAIVDPSGFMIPDPTQRPDDVPEDWVFIESNEDGPLWMEPEEAWEKRKQEAVLKRRGYCGLAGGV